jgi:hypothetical protein
VLLPWLFRLLGIDEPVLLQPLNDVKRRVRPAEVGDWFVVDGALGSPASMAAAMRGILGDFIAK